MTKFPNSLLAYMPSRSSAFFSGKGKMNINELYNVISENIRFYRMNNFKYGHITQGKLARLIGVDQKIITRIEEKSKSLVLNLTVINNIANALEIPIYKFFIKK